jgi:hypothetical protein
MPTSIYVDSTLPNHANLEAWLFKAGYIIVSDEAKATVRLQYAHDPEKQYIPSHLAKFNQAIEVGKTVFFLWYSWSKHYKRLTSYFHPENGTGQANLRLFDEHLCQHIQLPATNQQIQDAINSLLNMSNR